MAEWLRELSRNFPLYVLSMAKYDFSNVSWTVRVKRMASCFFGGQFICSLVRFFALICRYLFRRIQEVVVAHGAYLFVFFVRYLLRGLQDCFYAQL